MGRTQPHGIAGHHGPAAASIFNISPGVECMFRGCRAKRLSHPRRPARPKRPSRAASHQTVARARFRWIHLFSVWLKVSRFGAFSVDWWRAIALLLWLRAMRKRSVLWVVILLCCNTSDHLLQRSPLPYKVILRRLANCLKIERLPKSLRYPADHANRSAEPCFSFLCQASTRKLFAEDVSCEVFPSRAGIAGRAFYAGA